MIYGDVIAREGCVQGVTGEKKSPFFQARWNSVFHESPVVENVRGIGIGFNFDKLAKNFEINKSRTNLSRNVNPGYNKFRE